LNARVSYATRKRLPKESSGRICEMHNLTVGSFADNIQLAGSSWTFIALLVG